MLWIVKTARLRVPWRVAAASVLDHVEMPDGSFRWVVDLPEGSPFLLRMLPGVLSVDPVPHAAGAHTHGDAGQAAA